VILESTTYPGTTEELVAPILEQASGLTAGTGFQLGYSPERIEAELTKLLENTFRHVNIALVNEMVRFCDELDIDLWDAIDCAETKPFGYMAFRPGPGVGGHCIPVDPSYLSAARCPWPSSPGPDPSSG
jgi:UDP-N-acetyl-D-glucosamine dehydrogenase